MAAPACEGVADLPFIDLRSDTVTQPTDAMRRAMAEAVVGDDVMGEDPTVRELEERTAGLLGMEAGLFVPTGTMANQVAVWVHTGRQGQAICEENSHIALYEGGGAALLSGTTLRTVRGRNGVFGRADIAPHVFPDDPHFAPTRMVAIENTHNWSGGRLWSPEQTADASDAARRIRAGLHIDGARLFNAAVAQRVPPARLTDGATSVFIALSKGLSAPVGSVLCGTEDLIGAARRVRKVLGGGMRQSGVLAAAGLEALGMVDRLAEDHGNARRLADGLAQVPALRVDPAATETNMVLADISGTGLTSGDFCDLLRDAGIGCLPRDAGPTVRFVTHRHVTAGDVDEAVRRIRVVFEETPAPARP